MLATVKYFTQEDPLTRELKIYIQELIERESRNPVEVRKEAIEALKRTGVLTEDGKRKEKIVSWG